MKPRKVISGLVAGAILVAAISGGAWFYFNYQKKNVVAKVYPVEQLVMPFFGEENRSSGIVTNDSYQEVQLLEDQEVLKVYVEEGQTVKKGDPLLEYDVTLSQLELEMQELEVESLENKILLAKKELETLKRTTPIPEVIEPTEPEEEPVIEVPEMDAATGNHNYISGTFQPEIAAAAGDGSQKKPYIVNCMPGCYIEGAYLNQLAQSPEPVFLKFQIIDPQTLQSVKEKTWEINSKQLASMGMVFDDFTRWSVETREPVMEESWEEDIVDEPIEVPQQEVIGYTAAELATAIKETEKKIKDYDLEYRKAKLELSQMEEVAKDGVVKATINGVVKSVGDLENPEASREAFLLISGSDGLYVTGSLSEFMVTKVQPGQIIYANSWESGKSFEATIQEISTYPSETQEYMGEGNPAASYYPYTAYISDAEGLKNGEYVELTMAPISEESMMAESALYLQKAYVRKEDGRSYVMVADENGLLKKQYVTTGKTLYGEAIEIKTGLSYTDKIAFPYGKTAKEGVKTQESSDVESMYY